MLSRHCHCLEADASAERGRPGGQRSGSTRAARGQRWASIWLCDGPRQDGARVLRTARVHGDGGLRDFAGTSRNLDGRPQGRPRTGGGILEDGGPWVPDAARNS